MGKQYILDSNIVIYLLNGTLSAQGDQHIEMAAQQPIRLSIIKT